MNVKHLGGCNSCETQRGRSGLDVSQLRWFSHCIHNWSLDTPKDDPMNLIMNWNKTNQSPRDLGAKGKNANTSFSDRPFVRFYLASSSVNFNLFIQNVRIITMITITVTATITMIIIDDASPLPLVWIPPQQPCLPRWECVSPEPSNVTIKDL